jgi:hypothetical protein
MLPEIMQSLCRPSSGKYGRLDVAVLTSRHEAPANRSQAPLGDQIATCPRPGFVR